jgi:hypothetical protein
MEKKIVKFKKCVGQRDPKVGHPHIVLPMNHPGCSNGGWPAVTSLVVVVHEDGSFETENSIYELAEDW